MHRQETRFIARYVTLGAAIKSWATPNFHENMSIGHESDLRYIALQQTVVWSWWLNKLSVHLDFISFTLLATFFPGVSRPVSRFLPTPPMTSSCVSSSAYSVLVLRHLMVRSRAAGQSEFVRGEVVFPWWFEEHGLDSNVESVNWDNCYLEMASLDSPIHHICLFVESNQWS